MTPKVSVIIPTYNRQNEVLALVKKLINQDYNNLEIIVVNDGSTDGTINVLHDIYDRNLKIINKPNEGLSSARNAGIEVASGMYVIFIDDDDDIPSDYVSSLMKPEYNNIDLIIDSYCNQQDDKLPCPVNFKIADFKKSNDTLEWLCGHMPDRPYVFFAHGKRYKLSIIKDNSIRFSEKIKFVEDRPFVIDYIMASNTCRIVNNHKYIVKSVSQSKYRLSKGKKSTSWLWQNIHDSYEYLLKVEKMTKLSTIRKYADNYLATRSLDYLFTPYSMIPIPLMMREIKKGGVIQQMLSYVIHNVCTANIESRNAKIYFSLIRLLGIKAAFIWNLRIKFSALARHFIKR